jgi:uncharacterized protein
MTRLAGLASAFLVTAACATAPYPALAQAPTMTHAMPPMSSIQPETTISLNGRGSVERAPDVANVSLGVTVDGETASAAMAEQAAKMNGVMAALKSAGIAERDIQTGNLSLNPVYDYNQPNGRPRLTGYSASNQAEVRVRDLGRLGRTLDAIVKAGGNTINGVNFGIDKPEGYINEARIAAIKDAMAKADLYARAAGYKVQRIVTISENAYMPSPPQMMARMAMAGVAESAPTPVSGGEVSLTVDVNVVFELAR